MRNSENLKSIIPTVAGSNSENIFQYIPGFDTLRGFAVLLVLILHGSYGFFKGGWIGVDLFFVLSGYLITSLLLHEFIGYGKISISKFYARRALRLFPPLIGCIIIANFLWSYTELYPGANQNRASLAAIFYYTNLIPGNITGNLAHLWSLSVEEHFYLFWPVICSLLLFRLSTRKSLSFLVILIIAVSVFRIYVYNFGSQFANALITIDSNRFTFCKIDSISMGALLSFIFSKPEFRNATLKNRPTTLYLIILLLLYGTVLVTVYDYNVYWRNGGFILTNLVCVFTVILAILNPNHFLLSNKMVRWVGKRSYGIYVYHFPIFFVFEGLRQTHDIVNFLLVTILRFSVTIIVAELSYRYMEQPVLRFKKQFSPSLILENHHSKIL